MIASSFNNDLNQLDNERDILQKLLYRNHNQHENTKVFISFAKLNNQLKLLTSKKLINLNINIDKCLRSVKKISSRDLSSVLFSLKDLYIIVELILGAITTCSKSSCFLSRQLEQHVFIPLYSVLLALSSRVLKLLSTTVLHFSSQLDALVYQVKNVSITQERHSVAIEAILLTNSLSLDEQNIINILRDMMNKSTIINDIINDEKSIAVKKIDNIISDKVIDVVGCFSSNDEDMGEIIGAVLNSDQYSNTMINNSNLNNNNNNNNNNKRKRKNELVDNSEIEIDSLLQINEDKMKINSKKEVMSNINSIKDIIIEKKIQANQINDEIVLNTKTKNEFNMTSIIKNNKISKGIEIIDKKKKIKKKTKKSSDEIDNIFGSF